MAAEVARESYLSRRRRPRTPQILCARHVPVSVRCGLARRPSAGIYRIRYFRPLQTDEGLQRPASDGLRRLRPARRAVCHPDGPASGRYDRAQRGPLPRAARQNRLFVRLGARGADVRPLLLQMDAVGVLENVRSLVRPRAAEGPPRRGADRCVCRARHRGDRRCLHGRDALHRRRVERLG